jgi:hypothetical protein
MSDATVFNYTIEDDQGLHNNSDMYVAYDGATATVDSVIGAWTAFGGAIDACIDGQITGGSILVPLEPNGSWKSAPAVGNNVNQVMSLNFDNDFNQYVSPILLPSYKETTLTTPGRVPSIATTPLSTLIALIIAGTGSAFFPNSKDLHDLNALRDAFLTVRKVRNQKTKTRVG